MSPAARRDFLRSLVAPNGGDENSKQMVSSLIVAVHDPRESAHWRAALDVLAAVVRGRQPAAVRILPAECGRARPLEEWLDCLADLLNAALPTPFFLEPPAGVDASEAIYDADLVSLNADDHPWTLVLDLSKQPGLIITQPPLRALLHALTGEDKGLRALARREWALQLFERRRIDISMPETTLRDYRRVAVTVAEQAAGELERRNSAALLAIPDIALRAVFDRFAPSVPKEDIEHATVADIVRLAWEQS